METRANYVLVGSCVLAAIAGVVIFIFWLTSNQLNHEADTYYTYFTGSVAGLSSGSAVRYRGVPVGTVGTVEIDPANVERIRVTLLLNPGTPVKTDSVASLEMAGITGGSYVELTGGTQASPPLKGDDEHIPVIKAENSSLQSLVADAPKLLGKLTELADRADQMLSPENVKNLSLILSHLQDASADLAGLTPEAKAAMTNLDQLTTQLHTELPRLMGDLQQDGASIKGAADEFHQVAGSLDSVIKENRGPLRDFTGNGLTQMTGLITELRGLADTLTRVADRLDRDPQRYLFGGGSRFGVDPARPIGAGIPTGASQ